MATRARAAREDELRSALRLLYETVRRQYREAERRAGIASAPLRVLAEVVRAPGSTAAGLAQALGVRPATLSNLLKPLESAGLVERVRERRDQRVVRLQPSRRGGQLVETSGATGVLTAALAGLDDGELEALGAGLAALLRHVPAAARTAPSPAFRAGRRRRPSQRA